MIVYVTIGNSDDRLTQERWAEYWSHVNVLLERQAEEVFGAWVSVSVSPFQNACWCVRLKRQDLAPTRVMLQKVREAFDQKSVAWAEVRAGTEFV